MIKYTELCYYSQGLCTCKTDSSCSHVRSRVFCTRQEVPVKQEPPPMATAMSSEAAGDAKQPGCGLSGPVNETDKPGMRISMKGCAKMKKEYVLTVAIPCYNSEEYMGKAIESALVGGEDVEVIIVDDGSKDRTKAIGEEYAEKYPDNVKVISQENGGHGSAVNTGIENASGVFYKVLDSDDWFDAEAFGRVVRFLKKVVDRGKELDMFISNYVYEKVSVGKSKVINYRLALPVGRFFSWSDIGIFLPSQNILMHSVIYRTQMLRECGIKLPKHTFYVDNIFVFQPLPFVKTMYYMDVDLYRYFIGREDQSVNEEIMIGRIDQQLKITRLMMGYHDIPAIENKKLRNYMVKDIAMMMTVSTALLVRDGSEESLKKNRMIWRYLKKRYPELYRLVDRKILGKTMQMNTDLGYKVIEYGYLISRGIIGFS